MKKLYLICLISIIILSGFSYVYANESDNNQLNVTMRNEVKVFQPDGTVGYINIPKIENRFLINNYNTIISSSAGSFSFSLDEQKLYNNSISENTDNLLDKTMEQINNNEIKVEIVLKNTDLLKKVVVIPYNIKLPEGGYLEFNSDIYGNDHTSVVIYNSDKVAIGGFYSLNVKTKDGVELNSWFTIENSVLFQNISNPDNEEIFVEMKTTSLDYSHFYQSSGWISRPEQGQYALALSIYTNQNAQWDSFPSIAWEVLADRHRNDGYYIQGIFRYYFQGNEEGLYDQWLCHLMTIGHLKQPWNIEPSRPNVSYPATVAAGCNPIY